MRAGLVVPAVVAVLFSGCVTGRELRVQAERHAPVVPQHEERKLAPVTGLMLVNPLVCFQGGQACGGGDGYAALACAALLVGCVGVLGTVDLVALPVQAVRRHGQLEDLERIGVACPVDDPASRAASGLADRMVDEFGFTRGPADGKEAGAPAARGTAPAPVYVRVSTTRFERASRIEWNGRVEFVGVGEKVIWRRECGGHAPARAASTFLEECAEAREEVASLADQCVAAVTAELRKRWPEWDAANKSAGAESPEVPGGSDPWTAR